MGKDNTILMVGLGILAGYLLMPEKVKAIGGGGDGGGGINIPNFPGWGSIIKIPDFPGWGKLIPEGDIPTFPEVPAFPGWDKFFGGIGIPSPGNIVDIITDPGKAATGWIPTPEAIKAMIETYLGGIDFPSVDPRDLTGIIPEAFPFNQKVGGKRTFTEKLFGLSHNEDKGVWDRWADLITWNYQVTPITELTVETLGLEKSFWRSLWKGRPVYKPLAYGERASDILTESRGDSEINHPSYEPRGSRDADPVIETPVNLTAPKGSYTAYREGKWVGMDLGAAMRYGGGT